MLWAKPSVETKKRMIPTNVGKKDTENFSGHFLTISHHNSSKEVSGVAIPKR
jgi:hypothetical protein